MPAVTTIEDGVRIIDEQGVAGSAADRLRIQVVPCRGDPECGVADGQSVDHVLAVADRVPDADAEGSLVEPGGLQAPRRVGHSV